jgi:hypothetical protein
MPNMELIIVYITYPKLFILSLPSEKAELCCAVS